VNQKFVDAEQAARAILPATHVKGAKDIGIKNTMRDAQAAQHVRQHPTAAKGNHVNSAGTDLRPLKSFGGEATTAVGQPI
jgi:hypothetical protein